MLSPSEYEKYRVPYQRVLTIPARENKIFYLEWPGYEDCVLASTYPYTDNRIPHDCANPRGMIYDATWLRKRGYESRLLLPFYMRKFIPAHYRKFKTDFPMLIPGVPILGDFANAPAPGAWYKELAAHCQFANRRVSPAIFSRAIKYLAAGEAVAPAAAHALADYAPGFTGSLVQFAKRDDLLRRESLVRSFECMLTPGTATPYFKTGKALLDFFCDYGALTRLGKGRVGWSPIFANYFISIDIDKRNG